MTFSMTGGYITSSSKLQSISTSAILISVTSSAILISELMGRPSKRLILSYFTVNHFDKLLPSPTDVNYLHIYFAATHRSLPAFSFLVT